MTDQVPNPLHPEKPLKRPLEEEQKEEAHPPQPIFPEDSAITKAEKVERNGAKAKNGSSSSAEATQRTQKEDADRDLEDGPAAKRVKREFHENGKDSKVDTREKIKGIALVKSEYVTTILLMHSGFD